MCICAKRLAFQLFLYFAKSIVPTIKYVVSNKMETDN